MPSSSKTAAKVKLKIRPSLEELTAAPTMLENLQREGQGGGRATRLLPSQYTLSVFRPRGTPLRPCPNMTAWAYDGARHPAKPNAQACQIPEAAPVSLRSSPSRASRCLTPYKPQPFPSSSGETQATARAKPKCIGFTGQASQHERANCREGPISRESGVV